MVADVVQSNVLSGQATLIAGQRQLIDAADRTSGALTKLTDDTNEDKRIREEQSRQLSEILMEMKRKDVSVHVGAAKAIPVFLRGHKHFSGLIPRPTSPLS